MVCTAQRDGSPSTFQHLDLTQGRGDLLKWQHALTPGSVHFPAEHAELLAFVLTPLGSGTCEEASPSVLRIYTEPPSCLFPAYAVLSGTHQASSSFHPPY